MMVPPSCGTMANMQRLKSLVCFYHESGPNRSRAGGCAYVRFGSKGDIRLMGSRASLGFGPRSTAAPGEDVRNSQPAGAHEGVSESPNTVP